MDAIALSHGQARWLLAEWLHPSDASDSTFGAYLKYLRRNDVPVSPGETPGGPGVNVVCGYDHRMALALALVLHSQAILRIGVVTLLIDMREELRPLFRRAWLEQTSGCGAPVAVTVGTGKSFPASGLWLDLGLHYAAGGPLTKTGPKLVGPEGAIKHLCTLHHQQHYRDPIRISDYADDGAPRRREEGGLQM